MTDSTDPGAVRLAGYIATWHRACTDFVALARSIDEDQADRPTDLVGWNVRDNIAHTAHLEAVLAGAPEESVAVPEAPHITGPMGVYTEQGVIARRGRKVQELADELEQAVARRYDALQADPPTDPRGNPPATPGGIPWDNETLYGNRPLDVWMHEQDVRRALDLPGSYDSPAALHTADRLAAAFPVVLGKRVGADPGTTVRLDVPELDRTWTVTVGADRRARFDESASPDTTIVLSAHDFTVLAGGRRAPGQCDPAMTGDEALAAAFLARMAVTP